MGDVNTLHIATPKNSSFSLGCRNNMIGIYICNEMIQYFRLKRINIWWLISPKHCQFKYKYFMSRISKDYWVQHSCSKGKLCHQDYELAKEETLNNSELILFWTLRFHVMDKLWNNTLLLIFNALISYLYMYFSALSFQ